MCAGISTSSTVETLQSRQTLQLSTISDFNVEIQPSSLLSSSSPSDDEEKSSKSNE